MFKSKSRIYLDYAAATPMAPDVESAMQPYYREDFGNAGALHSFGQRANAAIDSVREIIAKELNVEFNEVIFTGSATEANNHILRGATKSFLKSQISNTKSQIIISAIEHESVFETANDLEKNGVEVIKIPVSKEGIIDIEKLKDALDENVAVVSIIFASNVIGTIQPIKKIAEIIKNFREEKGSEYPLFHTDAVQALQFIKLDMGELGVDALTLSGQKIYGPKGVGALAIKKQWLARVAPLVTGGTQEFGYRAGTQNTPAIVGFGKAVEIVTRDRGPHSAKAPRGKQEAERVKELRDMLWDGIKKIVPNSELNGSKEERLPNNLHVSFPGKDNQELLIKFDQAGIAVSIGSACSVRSRKASRVILELGLGEERATNSIRFTLGRNTTEEEIKEALNRITSLF